ncbi:MAG: hypothetical protein R8M14_08525 [Ghiorsea sp.]
MNINHVLKLSAIGLVTISSVMIQPQTARAFGSYLTDVNKSYGASYTNCLVCHSTAGGGTDKGVTAFANQYRTTHSAATIAALDADNDGFTNKQEGSVSSDLNSSASSPFTIAAAAVTVADKVLPNFVVKGDAAAVSQMFTDPYGLATAGKEILGGMSLTVNNAPVDVYYKAAGIDATMTLYNVDTYGQGTVSPPTTGWTVNADGSLRVVALAPGATQATAVLVRTVPTIVNNVINSGAGYTTGGDNDGEGDDGGASKKAGCLTSIASPLMMFFALLSLGFLVRRKQRC